MTWDWWYYHKTLTVGVPTATFGLAVFFAVHLQFVVALGLLVATAAEFCLWFYRWIEWRHPGETDRGGTRAQDSIPGGAPTFRRQGAAG